MNNTTNSVGETQQTLNARLRLHESMIRTRKENVAEHFNEEGHEDNQNFKINIVGHEQDKNR